MSRWGWVEDSKLAGRLGGWVAGDAEPRNGDRVVQ